MVEVTPRLFEAAQQAHRVINDRIRGYREMLGVLHQQVHLPDVEKIVQEGLSGLLEAIAGEPVTFDEHMILSIEDESREKNCSILKIEMNARSEVGVEAMQIYSLLGDKPGGSQC